MGFVLRQVGLVLAEGRFVLGGGDGLVVLGGLVGVEVGGWGLVLGGADGARRGEAGGAAGAGGVEGRGHRPGVVAVIVCEGEGLGPVDLEMLPQAAGVGVALVAAPHPAVVRLVRGVDMHVLLSVRGIGEPSVTTLNLALEWFLSCKLKEYLELHTNILNLV